MKNYRIRINTKTSSKHGDFNKKKKMFSFHSKKAMKKQIYHEIGHMLVSDMKGMSYSFNLKRAIRDERSLIYGKNTKLDKKNRYEYFAWGYEQYIKNSKKLKKRCPKTWLLMDLSSKCVYQQYAYFKDLDEKQLYSESDWWLGEHVLIQNMKGFMEHILILIVVKNITQFHGQAEIIHFPKKTKIYIDKFFSVGLPTVFFIIIYVEKR